MALAFYQQPAIPIAILTRNRHAMLDVTLRSLSATHLPRETPLVIYDDASDDAATREYLYGSGVVHVATRLPDVKIAAARRRAKGLAGRVTAVRLGHRSGGVVSAGCRALRHLMDQTDVGGGVILLQDDVVFRADWMTRLRRAATRASNAGLIAGLHLNLPNPERRPPVTPVPEGGLTAQCYWLTPTGLRALEPWVRRRQRARHEFDTRLCEWIRQAGLGVYRAFPPVGQHVGCASLVRPHWTWTWRGPQGRIDVDAEGPYAMAEDVRAFPAPF